MKGFWTKKLPAALLTLVMLVGLVPAASAASADHTYNVYGDDSVYLDAEDFQNIYEDMTDWGELEYIEFTSYDDFDDYGYFAFTDFGNHDYDDVDYYDLGDYDFYCDYNSSDASKDDIDLDTLEFVTYDDVDSATLDFSVRMYGDEGRETATIRINVKGSSSSSSSSKSNTITYKVAPNGKVSFDSEDFSDIFDKKYSNYDLCYVTFDRSSSSAFSDGTLYAKYGKSGAKSFTQSSLSGYDFYYDDSDYGDYKLDDLSFVADRTFEDDVTLNFTAYGPTDSRYVEGTVKIIASGSGSSGSSAGDGDIAYEADSGEKVTFDMDDFLDLFEEEYDSRLDDDFSYVVFDDADNLDDCGKLYAYDYSGDKYQIKESKLDDYKFFYSKSDIDDEDYDYRLEKMYYQVDTKADDETVTLYFTLYGDSSKNPDTLEGTLTITIGDGGSGSSSSSKKGDITYKAPAGKETSVDPDDFNDYFQKKYNNDFRYLEFTGATGLTSTNGALYVNYDYKGEKKFSSASSLEDVRFYYDDEDYGDYDLADLSFVAAKNFKSAVTLKFRAYYSSSKYVDGTLVFDANADGSSSIGSFYMGNIRYSATTGNKVQINANDIARFYTQNRPGCTLSFVKLGGVPATGALWYNHYGTSKYGGGKTQLTAGSANSYAFYNSPSSASQYALTELTYVPSGTNYCTAIPFTAYGTGTSVSGAILISVTGKAVSEVYSVTTKNTPINLSANSIYNVVLNATGYAPSSIQFLGLPTYAQGSLYLASSYTSANVTTRYTYGSGSASISQLQFMPTTGFTGSVELPYVALNANGTAIASGVYSIGVVSSVKRFSDVTSSTWCYKYVTELSDANVIAGYTDGSFKPDSTVTYGAALKLIMLAAGYPEQKPTNSNVFSGYLAKAKADKLVEGNPNLSKPITRGAVAQLAAKAMKLNTTNLSAVKPFTDTSDPYIQALNAAGIVEGYFANGTSTFKPNNTLTRGQVSAIVWRMRNYNK